MGALLLVAQRISHVSTYVHMYALHTSKFAYIPMNVIWLRDTVYRRTMFFVFLLLFRLLGPCLHFIFPDTKSQSKREGA